MRIEPKRFSVQAWGQGWYVLDNHTRTIVGTVGDLDARILQAEILNKREEEKCRKNKVIPIR